MNQFFHAMFYAQIHDIFGADNIYVINLLIEFGGDGDDSGRMDNDDFPAVLIFKKRFQAFSIAYVALYQLNLPIICNRAIPREHYPSYFIPSPLQLAN